MVIVTVAIVTAVLVCLAVNFMFNSFNSCNDAHGVIPEWAYISILIWIPAPFGAMLANKLVHPEVKE